MIRQTEAEIVHKEDLGGAGFRLVVHTPGTEAELPLPGQFAMLRPVGCSAGVYLGRPISYLDAVALSGGTQRQDFYIKVYGLGSQELVDLPVGAKIDLMGCLGKGFPFPEQRAAMVAGGVGVAPLYHLACEWARRGGASRRFSMYYGGRQKKDLPFLEELNRFCGTVRTTTEDGSHGLKGYVTRALCEDLEASSAPQGERLGSVMTCGPTPMMRAVAKAAEQHGLPCLLSLETRMACGYGVCLGCVVHVDGEGYVRACVEGPVLEAGKLNFSERWL